MTGAIVLAGGLGSRLRAAVGDRQKAVAEVAGRPFVELLLRQLAHFKITPVTLACGYRADTVRSALEPRWPELLYSVEPERLDTAGAIRLAADLTPGDPLVAMNGDSFLDLDFAAFLDWFGRSGFEVAAALTQVPDIARYGAVTLDGERITGFREKGDVTGPGWVNGGVYAFRRAALTAIPEGIALSLERDIFPGLAAAGKLGGFRSQGRFLDIGTPETYTLAQTFFDGKDC
ncbi:MAG: sugar phosphate nucleotidyltransferase [Victivallaceae bacterium]